MQRQWPIGRFINLFWDNFPVCLIVMLSYILVKFVKYASTYVLFRLFRYLKLSECFELDENVCFFLNIRVRIFYGTQELDVNLTQAIFCIVRPQGYIFSTTAESRAVSFALTTDHIAYYRAFITILHPFHVTRLSLQLF
jgi:hypothetical protein